MNKRTVNYIGAVVAVTSVFTAMILLNTDQGINGNEPSSAITQKDLREMVDDWMSNPDNDDRMQRLEIMKAFYTFQESGQWFSDDQEGRVLYNQIVKMVSFDIPKTELNQIKQEIRAELQEMGFQLTP